MHVLEGGHYNACFSGRTLQCMFWWEDITLHVLVGGHYNACFRGRTLQCMF